LSKQLTTGTHIIPKTRLSTTAHLLGTLIVFVVVVVAAYFVHIVFEPGIGNVLAAFLILAGFLTLTTMIAESIGKK